MTDTNRTTDEGRPLDGRVRAHSPRGAQMPDAISMLVGRMRSIEDGHAQHAWTEIKIQDISALCDEIERLNFLVDSDYPFKTVLEALTSTRDRMQTASLNHSLSLAKVLEESRRLVDAEREACAEACEAVHGGPIQGAHEEYLAGKEMASQQCARAIRMRVHAP